MWTRKQSNYQNFVLCVSVSDQELELNGCFNISSSLLLHIAVLCFPLIKMQILTPTSEVKQTKYRKIGLQSVQELPLLGVRGHFIHT